MDDTETRLQIRCPNCDRVVATLPDLAAADHAYVCPYCRTIVKPPFSLRRLLRSMFGTRQ